MATTVKVWIVWAGVRREGVTHAWRFAVYAPTRLFASWNALDVIREGPERGAYFVAGKDAPMKGLHAPRVARRGERLPSLPFTVSSRFVVRD